MVVYHRRSLTPFVLTSCLLLPLSGCASGSLRETLTRAFAADPKLTEGVASSPVPAVVATSPSPLEPTAQLPEDFPADIPCYPGATLSEVVSGEGASSSDSSARASEVVTRWLTSDGGDRVLSFYRKAFQTNGWQILNQPKTGSAEGTIAARQADLKVNISVQSGSGAANARSTPAGSTSPTTELVIQYARNPNQSGSVTTEPDKSVNGMSKLAPFSSTTGLGVAGDSERTQSQTNSGDLPFTDLNKTPAELRQYVEDVARLGILTPAATRQKHNQTKDGSLFEPNKVITRREYARWLIAANNRFYSDRPTQQIRLGLATSQPAFRDVPKSDPDFPAIQGLAEAGIIPSSLSGDVTVVNFRPNVPLTRENLLLWKVPIDTRQALPKANIETVKQTWGFHDTARIDPKALRAVLADYQNGDLSNIRRVFGYTTLLQPKKAITRAEAAATLWYFGFQGEGQSARDAAKQ